MLGGLVGTLGLAQENSVTVQEEEGQATSAGSSSKLSVQRSRQKAHRAQGEHRMQPPTNMLCEPQPSTALMSCLGKVGQVHGSEIANLRY